MADADLSAKEKEEIRQQGKAADSLDGFTMRAPGKKTLAKDDSAGPYGAKAGAAGGRSQAGGAFAALAVAGEGSAGGIANVDPHYRDARNEAKKVRRKEEREAKAVAAAVTAGPTVTGHATGESERDELEQQLAKKHLTAEAAKLAVPARSRLKKLKPSEIESFTLKQLRRALTERGVNDSVRGAWVDTPGEIKQLREYAKSLPSVCEGAVGFAKKPKRFTAAPANREIEAEVDKILAELDQPTEGGSRLAVAGEKAAAVVSAGATALGSAAQASANLIASMASRMVGRGPGDDGADAWAKAGEADEKKAPTPRKTIKQLRAEKEQMNLEYEVAAKIAARRWAAQAEMPTEGEALKCSKLAEALASGKTEFAQAEFENLGVKGLTTNSFIRAGGQWFKPVGLTSR